MQQDFLQLAHADLPVYLTDVYRNFQKNGTRPFHLRLTLYDGTARSFPLQLPPAEGSEETAFLAEYVHAFLYNLLSSLGARVVELYFDPADQALQALAAAPDRADVAAALDWCIEHMPDSVRCLTVSSNWESMELPLQSIRYIEILGHQAHIHTERDDIVARRGLDDLEAAIDSPDFLRCHRSYLVNMNHVLGLEGSDFRMNGGDLVPISSANAAKVRSRFIDWTYLKAWGQK